MIRRHEFNTRWWGSPVGIIDDPLFFDLPDGARAEALASYEWVEFRSTLAAAPPLADMARAGFFLADTQVTFRIALKEEASACGENLCVRFACEPGFEFRGEDLAAFEHERYALLAGNTPERLDARYAEWARESIRDHPEDCLAVLSKGAIQGWFFSQREAGGLNLALAAAHRDARISGYWLYERSLAAYASKGHRVGFASFSVSNCAVHNIYAKLGARFTAPVGIWLWTPIKP